MIRKCFEHLQYCLEKDSQLRHLLVALESAGCPINFKRHIVCEEANDFSSFRGGFDASTKQLVLFPDNIKTKNEFCTILKHELIHAYDYCRVQINFNNIEHLACTEIRAASLTECTLSDYFSMTFSPFLSGKHEYCVKRKAQQSLEICTNKRTVAKNEIDETIKRVFKRCSNDTEPFNDKGAQR
ncbi:unnamed protein product [Didymodactylos carnosus]|uniref:Mitochondrial inner membrane protease ATP23 n=1 Tax=Didymodactylos carnosus TaxID=1234261 RepID=A0A814C167_9BILA|nr:unnamed protein product [Didymodactylos carnosus]CAF3712130.1 unnamed protein product [Didymodactylos carnosus]